MRVCWDNIIDISYDRDIGLFINKKKSYYYVYVESCSTCGNEFLARKDASGKVCSAKCLRHKDTTKVKMNKFKLGKPFSKAHKEAIRLSKLGNKNHFWKGGYSIRNIPLFDTYAPQIDWHEKVRRDAENEKILQVKCIYCGKWYNPTLEDVRRRIRSINGKLAGDNNFYCSHVCKILCPIFYRHQYYKGMINRQQYQRNDQEDWRELVLLKDNFKCVKCGSIENLIAHHKEGIRWEPLESADIDMGITLCKECHREVHKKEGCTSLDMRCNQ